MLSGGLNHFSERLAQHRQVGLKSDVCETLLEATRQFRRVTDEKAGGFAGIAGGVYDRDSGVLRILSVRVDQFGEVQIRLVIHEEHELANL